MRVGDNCGCFPTGRYYPGIAHLIRPVTAGVVEQADADAGWIDQTIAFVDVETTGTDPRSDRIIELGIVMGRGGEVRERLRWLVDPEVAISREASEVHGITDADVAGQPRFPEVVGEVLRCFEGAIAAAYNAPFDRGFLMAEIERAAVAPSDLPPGLRPEVDWIDPLVLARELFKGQGESRALGAVAGRLGIELPHAHRATDDAEAALRVLYAFAADPRVPRGYAALIQEQRRLERAQQAAQRFWRK
jgi:DNA polymerase-3 subunit epsilon